MQNKKCVSCGNEDARPGGLRCYACEAATGAREEQSKDREALELVRKKAERERKRQKAEKERESTFEVAIIVTTSGEEVDVEDKYAEIAWRHLGRIRAPKKGDAILFYDDDDGWVQRIVKAIRGKTISIPGDEAELDSPSWRYPGTIVPPKIGDSILIFDDEEEVWVKQVVKDIRAENRYLIEPDDEDEDA